MSIDNTKIVSWRFLFWAIGPIIRHEDVEEGEMPELEFPSIDSHNPVEVKERVIRAFIVPWIRSCDGITQRITKDSFRYYLNVEMPDRYGIEFFQGLFNSIIPNFEGPKPIRHFFVWIWEELYGQEDYHTDDLSSYVVDNATPYDAMIRVEQKQ
jgi:hypothetical protein